MPPREPKGRFLTREYMADAQFHRAHDAATRELYMMLAMFTDDAGWLEWDPDYLVYAMYRYDNDRDQIFSDGIASLVKAGRLRLFKCGHGVMPKVAGRPRSGEHEYRVRDDHESRCSRLKSTRTSRLETTNGRLKSSRPPNLTLPNLTNTTTTRGRAREASDASPRSLKDVLGEFEEVVKPKS
jgi:hypothetical protein